jgi:hypothetical protein
MDVRVMLIKGLDLWCGRMQREIQLHGCQRSFRQETSGRGDLNDGIVYSLWRQALRRQYPGVSDSIEKREERVRIFRCHGFANNKLSIFYDDIASIEGTDISSTNSGGAAHEDRSPTLTEGVAVLHLRNKENKARNATSPSLNPIVRGALRSMVL